MTVRVLSAADVAAALPASEAVTAVRDAFVAVQHGTVVMPPRLHLDAERLGGVTLTMPAHDPQLVRTAVKVVSVYPGNRDVPAVTGLVVLLDGATGRPLAILDGVELTARRTGGASGVATDALARADARVLAVVGAGAQAADQVRAVCAVRPIEQVRLVNRTSARAVALADRLRRELNGIVIDVAGSVTEALDGTDVVCTATSAETPVLSASDVCAGTHVNAVGSFRPGMRELPRELLDRAGRVFVDQPDAARAEAGEVIDVVAAGALAHDDLVPIGAVLAGAAPGRRDDQDVTVFKSCGLAAQDLYAAARTLANAEADGSGRDVEL